MKAKDWDDRLLADHRKNITDADTVAAFDFLVEKALELEGFLCSPKWQGDVRIFAYTDRISEERPFTFIVNQGSLLFYVRTSGLARVRCYIDQLRATFPGLSETKRGELKIRLASLNQADALFGLLFDRVHAVSDRANTILLNSEAHTGSAMIVLKLVAARAKQGDLTLYTTSIAVRELTTSGFYSVETLDPDNSNDRGYQRLLNTARAKKLADYIVSGQDSKDAFLPTSVFLATDKTLPYDETTHILTIDSREVGAFSVVDGQHRLEGLRMAAEKDPRVATFEVPVNIAVNLPRIAQMCHFLIVNTTQKSVDKSVEQRIIKRLTDAIDVEDLPSLPKWILRTVERGEVDKAVRYVDFLNSAEGSPWKGKIQMANEETEGTTVKQKSFVKSIVKYVLTANNPLTAYRDFEKEQKIFLNYWKAVAELLDDGNSAVLFKYNGLELFCKFSIPFFTKLQDKGDFTVKTMTSLLQSCFDNAEGEYAGVGHPEWWAKGSSASFMNAGAINQVSQELARALHKATISSPEIKL